MKIGYDETKVLVGGDTSSIISKCNNGYNDDTNNIKNNDDNDDNNNEDVNLFLTLGDGDFSYSLDLCRYVLRAKLSLDDGVVGNSDDNGNKVLTRIMCTGIDTSKDLHEKYRDSGFILRHILATGTKTKLAVSILHGVNAVPPFNDEKEDDANNITATKSTIPSNYHHVIFNYPHLGIENAALHGRFLCHLFYASHTHFLKLNGGVLHLTLLKGQYERWKCVEAAERNGFVLVGRNHFCPPPLLMPPLLKENNSNFVKKEENRYQNRRHQNGRSFTPSSSSSHPFDDDYNQGETFTFGRKIDDGRYVAKSLPWQNSNDTPNYKNDSSNDTEKRRSLEGRKMVAKVTESKFNCLSCGKTFREERSLKSHVKAVHDTARSSGDETIVITTNTGSLPSTSLLSLPIVCDICTKECDEKKKGVDDNDNRNNNMFSSNMPPRTFRTLQSLEDHKRAKHSGLHTYIRPDWASATMTASSLLLSTSSDGDDHKISNNNNNNNNNDKARKKPRHGEETRCTICNIAYSDSFTVEHHAVDFLPLISDSHKVNDCDDDDTAASVTNTLPSSDLKKCSTCIFCKKGFKETRAQRQHENVCSLRFG